MKWQWDIAKLIEYSPACKWIGAVDRGSRDSALCLSCSSGKPQVEL
jgi:hypothetical protein